MSFSPLEEKSIEKSAGNTHSSAAPSSSSASQVANQALSQTSSTSSPYPTLDQLLALKGKQIAELSLLRKLPAPPSDPFDERVLTNVLRDNFFSSDRLLPLSEATALMLQSLDQLISKTELFNEIEIVVLSRSRQAMQQHHEQCLALEQISSSQQLYAFASRFADRLSTLSEGEQLILPGGWQGRKAEKKEDPDFLGHHCLYIFSKQSDGCYSLSLLNTGAGLPSYHDFIYAGNKQKFKPYVVYSDIPAEVIFLPWGSHTPNGFFIAALVESLTSLNLVSGEKHIYESLLGHLEIYRALLPSQALSGYITSQRSETSVWKVNTLLLRLMLPVALYKKTVTAIKFNILIEEWSKCQSGVSEKQILFFRQAAQQLSRRLAKALADSPLTNSYRQWLLRASATVIDLLDHLEAAQAKSAERQKSSGVVPLELDPDECRFRKEILDHCRRYKNTFSPIIPTDDLLKLMPTLLELNDPLTVVEQLQGLLKQLDALPEHGPWEIHAGGSKSARGYPNNHLVNQPLIAAAARALPLPSLDDVDPFWDRVPEPLLCLAQLSKLASIFTFKKGPTLDELNTFMTFYLIVHRLTLRIEAETKDFQPYLRDCGLYEVMTVLDEDRYLICNDGATFERYRGIYRYITQWNRSRPRKIENGKKQEVLFIPQDLELNDENARTIPDLKFCVQMIGHFKMQFEAYQQVRDLKLPAALQGTALLLSEYGIENHETFKVPLLSAFQQLRILARRSWSSAYIHGGGNRVSIDEAKGGKVTLVEPFLSGHPRQFPARLERQFLLPKVNSLISNTIGLADWGVRQLDKIPTSISESRILGNHASGKLFDWQFHGWISKSGTRFNPDLNEKKPSFFQRWMLFMAERAAADPFLQPAQLLYLFEEELGELADKNDGIGYQVLFFTSFFKMFTVEDELISPALQQLRTQSSLRTQVASLITKGLDYFWSLKADRRPEIIPCLFFIQLAQRVRLALKGTDLATQFMANLERETIDLWIEEEGLTDKEKGWLTLFRLHGYCHLPYDQLPQSEIATVLALWSFWRQFPADLNHEDVKNPWVEISRRVDNYFPCWLSQLGEFDSDRLNAVFSQMLLKLGSKRSVEAMQWAPAPQHPTYQATGNDGNVWKIDLASGVVESTSESFKSGDDYFMRTMIGFSGIERSLSENYLKKKIGNEIYINDSVQGEFRLVLKEPGRTTACYIEKLMHGQWCQEIRLKGFAPEPFVSIVSFYVLPEGADPVKGAYVYSMVQKKTIGYLSHEGRIMLQHYELRKLKKHGTQKTFNDHISKVDEAEYVEVRIFPNGEQRLVLPRLPSLDQEPLQFTMSKGRLIWSHDSRYFLASGQEPNLLPGCESYLVLEKSDGSERKLLVKYEERKHGSVGECISTSYLDFTLTATNQLTASNSSGWLFLARRYLVNHQYRLALSALRKIESSDQLSPHAKSLLTYLLQSEKKHPNQIAILLHAFLMRWSREKNDPEMKDTRKQVKQECRNEAQDLYIGYLAGISNVECDLELSHDQERVLVEQLLHDAFDEIVRNRKAFLDSVPKSYPSPKIESMKRRDFPRYSEAIEDKSRHVPDFFSKKDYDSLRTPASNTACFFWFNAKAILEAKPEQKASLRYKLQLIYSNDDDYTLLNFLLTAPPELLGSLGPLPAFPDKEMRIMPTDPLGLWYVKLNKLAAKEKARLPVYEGGYRLVDRGSKPYQPKLLKSEGWREFRGPTNLPRLELGTLQAQPEKRHALCKAHFDEAIISTSTALTLSYDKAVAPSEEKPHQKAIVQEYEEFQRDFEAGQEQLMSHSHWKFKSAESLQRLNREIGEVGAELYTQFVKVMQEIRGLANICPPEAAQMIPHHLHQSGGLSRPLSVEDLVLLFLKGNSEQFIQANKHLQKEMIRTLYQKIGAFLWIATEFHALTRAQKLCEKIEQERDPLSIRYHTELLAQELTAKRHYNPSARPEFLVFEYCSNLLMRERQVELLELMLQKKDGRYTDCVIQLIMGGGKTSVLASILCYLAAQPDRLSLFITPASQFETVKENLKVTQRKCFNQSILALEFSRADLDVDFLREMTNEVKQAMSRGEMAIMRVESLQVLELEFISSIRTLVHTTEDYQKLDRVLLLRELLLLMRSKADALIDEVDTVLNALQTVNFPEGSLQHVLTEQIELLREIYLILASPTILVEDSRGQKVSLRDFVGLPLNKQTLLTQQEISEKVAPAVARQLAVHHHPLMLKDQTEEFVRYVSGQMDHQLEEMIGTQDKTQRRQLTPQQIKDLEFLESLRMLSLSKNPSEQQAADLAGLTKHLLRTLLPITLGKSGGRHYGRTRTAPVGKVVPYLAVDTPATTEFGYHFEALCYQFQTALQFGITAEQIRQLGQTMSKVVEHQVKQQRISFGETPEALAFKELTSVYLATVDKPGELKKAVAFVNGNLRQLLSIEAETCVEAVTYYPERMESTAQSVICQIATRRAFSGTPWNSEGYYPALSAGLHLDVGTEGQIACALVERARQGKLAIHTSRSENPGEMLRTLMENHTQRSRIRGFMDPGALFKKSDNLTVAREMLEVLQELQPEIKGILFFYRPAGKETADTLALLRPDAPEPILIHGTNHEAIQMAGLTTEDYFVYYDERHTTGTDILQVPSAINLVTVDETLLRRSFFQAVLRLRQFFFSQTVELLIPEASKKCLVGNGESIDQILVSIVKNQAIHKSKYLYRCFKQMLENIFRQEALQQLFALPEKVANYTEAFKKFEPFLVGHNRNNPYEAFGRLDSEVPSLRSLELIGKRLVSLWKSQGLSFTAKLEKELKQALLLAQKSCMQAVILEPGSETIGVEQEVNTLVQVNVQQEQEVQLEQELQQELQRFQAVVAKDLRAESWWGDAHWVELLQSLSEGRQPKGTPLVQPLRAYQAHWSLNEKPYHQIFGALLATENFVQPFVTPISYFHKGYRPANQLLIFNTIEGYRGILLSGSEGQVVKQWLSSQQQNELVREVWLVQPDGKCLVDNCFNPTLPTSREVQKLLIEMNALNGNAAYLDHHALPTAQWLSEVDPETKENQLALKTQFLQLRVEYHPKQRRIFYSSRALQPERVAAGSSQGIRFLARFEADRKALMDAKQVAQLSDQQMIQELPEELVQYVTPPQVPLLMLSQLYLLSTPEQIAAILPEHFTLTLLSGEQVPHFTEWQVKRIRNHKQFLRKLTQEQVKWMAVEEVNNLSHQQISWLREPHLIQVLQAGNIRYLNSEAVPHLLDAQITFLEGEQVQLLPVERFGFLDKEQLLYLSAEQIEKIADPVVLARLKEVENQVQQLSTDQVAKLVKLTFMQMSHLSESSLQSLSSEQVQQFTGALLDRLPTERLTELSEQQLEGITAAQTGVIHRLAKEQFFKLSGAALAEISDKQVQLLADEQEISLLPAAKLEKLSQQQLEKIESFELIKLLPLEALPKLAVSFVYQLSFESLQELGQEKVQEFSVLQKLALSVHYLVVGLLKLIPVLLFALLTLPLGLIGYPIAQDWERVTLTLEQIRWSVTIWL